MAITFTVLLCLGEFWGGWGQTPMWEEISLEIDELKGSGEGGHLLRSQWPLTGVSLSGLCLGQKT